MWRRRVFPQVAIRDRILFDLKRPPVEPLLAARVSEALLELSDNRGFCSVNRASSKSFSEINYQ